MKFLLKVKCLFFVVIIVWGGTIYSSEIWKTGEVSVNLCENNL